MTKHSKNNTASSIFSYAEYKRLEYGTKRQRLGRESMRDYDACALCLQKARGPVSCSSGHLFCKECVLSDILKQKTDIKKQKARLEKLKREAEEERQRAKEEARTRVLLEFERGQLGLGGASPSPVPQSSTPPPLAPEKKEEKSKGKQKDENMEKGGPHGTKRTHGLAFSEARVEELAAEAEERALKRIKQEQADALKAKLPDFWLPSLTPTYTSSGPPQDLKDIKLVTMCRGGQETHEISMKSLIPLEFAYPKDLPPGVKNPEDRRDAICPSCKKTLSNNLFMFLMSTCSHVVCKTCTDELVRPSSQCIVCDKPATKDTILELKREGTGYAAGGLAETSKVGVAFQG